MQPRTLEAILNELNPIYEPQVKNIRTRQSLIPGQIADEEKGLQAKQANAFDDILGGARRRGLGFSGIPLQEQARYTASEFLPSIARLRQTGREQAMSLEDAILGINERKQTAALGMRQYEQQRYDQEMARLRAEEEARRARAASSSGGGGLLSSLFGGTSASGQQNKGQPAKASPALQQLFNQVFIRPDGREWTDQDLVSDYNATLKSAKFGNTRDKQKIQLYHANRPDLFGGAVPVYAVASNGSQLRF